MSPDTDPYWVGAFAMAAARALHWSETGFPEKGKEELSRALKAFAESPVFDEGLQHQLAPYWEPRKDDP